jgi:catechol 2,3-dioxygenase-like lactoylglutathione lyase family enzyme
MLPTLGMRHVALHVPDPQKSKEFYVRVMHMKVEWEPDPENIYLTSGGLDNLALHQGPLSTLDHIGFFVPTVDDVARWYDWVKSQNVKILKEPKTHRDGARTFYFADPDGIVIQILFHEPISARARQDATR